MKTTVHTINDRVILGIRGADIEELENLLRVLSEWHSILSTDSVLSSCMSMIFTRLHEIEPVRDFDEDICETVTVYLGKRVHESDV